MPDFGSDCVSSSLTEFMSVLFFQRFFLLFYCLMYATQTAQTTDSTRAMQGACYNKPPASRAGSNTTRVR